MGEELIGTVTHYFGKPGVAGITLAGDLELGDTIRISGHTTELTQAVDSMQIDHATVEAAGAGDGVGVRVRDRVRVGDKVYLVSG